MKKNHKDKIDVHVIAPAKEQSGIGSYTDDLFKHMSEININRNILPADSNNPLEFARCAVKIHFTDSDIVHIQHEYGLFGPGSVMSFIFFPIIYLFSTIQNQPVIITIHEALNENLVTSPLYHLKQLYIKLLNNCITFGTEYIIFLSENSAEKFTTSINLESYDVLPHGADPTKQIEYSQDQAKRRLEYRPTDVVISEPGYVEPRKGNAILVEIAEQLPEYEFVIAGGPPDEGYSDYFEQIQQNAPDNLKVTGHLSEEMFHATFVASDIILLPYHKVDQKGIVNALNQSGIFNRSATYGKPVIAADLIHFNKLESEWNCLLTNNFEDTDTTIKTIQTLLTNDAKRREISEQIKRYASVNSFDKIAEQHLDIYREIIS